MGTSRARRLLEIGSLLVRPLPIGFASAIGEQAGRIAARANAERRRGLEANLSAVLPNASADAIGRLAVDGFGSYGRYWAESLRLPTLSASTIDAGFDVVGYEHIQRSRAAGFGPIMILPHLGGWEWAAAWLGRVADIPVSAVVERLEPDDVFEWFRELRESYGVSVIPLGADAMGKVAAAIKARHVVCLLADRDIAGSGVEVEFFGRPASLPIGPALLSRRTGAPLLPTAVYFDHGRRTGYRHVCRIAEPIWPERSASLRTDLRVMTEKSAAALETLIRRAPSQWHVLEPLWVP